MNGYANNSDNDTIIQSSSDLIRLRKLIEQLNQIVGRQRSASTDPTNKAITALRDNNEITRLLVYAQRTIEELERRLQVQAAERRQLKALQDVGAAVNSSLELEQVLNGVMDVIIKLTNAERAMLLLKNEMSNRLDVHVARNMDRETIEKSDSFKISRSIVRRVQRSGEPVVTMNAQEDERFASQQSIINFKLRSILCVPLKIKENTIGVIYADNRIAAGIFAEPDRDLLAAFANQAAVAIENARLFAEIRKNLAEITEMKELMDNVFASIASGVITIDESDRIALYNQAAERILGVDANSVLHNAYQKVLLTLGLPVGAMVREVKTNGGTQNTELDIYVAERLAATTLNMTFSPLRDNQGVAMVLDDISEKKRMESVRRYLPPKLVDQVRDLDAAQRPQRRVMTVMFADVRGFSTMSEFLDPEVLIQIINKYFTVAVGAITRYQGLTDKFMGDAVMALFNTPLNPQEDHVLRAIQTALMIRRDTADFYDSLSTSAQQLHFGIGIHSGEAVVGNVGSHLRKDYSAIGDAVNLAKRLQEVAKPDQIIISEHIYQQLSDRVEVTALPAVQVKGRQTLEQIYLLTAMKYPDEFIQK